MPTAFITASSEIVEIGREIELRWGTSGAASASIDQAVGAVALTGYLRVTPQASTTWTITADDGQGNTVTASVTVTVNPRAERSLLPPNATEFERAMEAAARRPIDVPIRKLWSSADCPLALLPQLAWALGVEDWDPDAPEAVKRAAIANAFRIHSEKGTLAGLKRLLDAAGAQYTYTERPAGVPMTARLAISNSASVYLPSITEAVDRVKRASLHLETVLSAGFMGEISVAGGVGAAVVVDIPDWTGYQA